MKFWSLLLFFLCLNGASGIVSALVSANVLVSGFGGPSGYSSSEVLARFDIATIFSASAIGWSALAGGIVGLIGIMLRQGIFAIYAVLVFVLGLFLGVATWVFTGFGQLMTFVFASTGLEFMAIIIEGIFLAFFFMFLASVLAQRSDLT